MDQYRPATQADAAQTNSDLTIIVGTGRCGSTMISNLLREHPDVLSLSEFFTLLEGPRFSEDIVDASQFWAILSTPGQRLTGMLRYGLIFKEFLYPVGSAARFTPETGVPPVLLVTLPHLTADYEAVFDEMQQVVSHFPPDQIEQQYARLFAWMKQRFGRRVSVERSGVSIPLLPSLLRLFPEAKFVHIIRDGRECAMSMSRHMGFRLAALTSLQEIGSDRTVLEGTQANADGTQSQAPDLAKAMRGELPIEIFGQFWSNMLIMGTHYLAKLPEERVLTITYEQFREQPQQSAERLITFIDPSLARDTWIETVAPQVRVRPLTWTHLPAQQREALEEACRPGLNLVDIIMQEGMHSKKLANILGGEGDSEK